MTQLPAPLRASIGLVATAVDNARNSPEKLLELPMVAVSRALQLSLRAQQTYAELTVRGDAVLSQLHGTPEEAPAWAVFDDSPTTVAPEKSVPKRAPKKAESTPKRAASQRKPSAFDTVAE